MTRVAMILGLIALFGLGYAGIERIGLADARVHSIRAARANAHLAAIVGELEWGATLERLRGVAESAAGDLDRKWPASSEPTGEQLRTDLATVLDRAGGRGIVAVFSAERNRVASVAPSAGADLDANLRPIEDARAGALTAQLVGGASSPAIVAAAPLSGGRVLALSVPFDRRLIAPWVQAEGPAGDLAIVGVNGELIASTIDAGMPARIPRGTFNLDIGERAHAAASRPLNDDAGTVGAFVGLSPYDVVLIEAVVKRLRLVYGTLAAMAIALSLFASFFIGRSGAGAPAPEAVKPRTTANGPASQEAWDGIAAEVSNAGRAVTADHLMAAARVLDGSGPLPAVKHSESVSVPPLRYSAAPPEAPSAPPGPGDRLSWGPGTPSGPVRGPAGGIPMPPSNPARGPTMSGAPMGGASMGAAPMGGPSSSGSARPAPPSMGGPIPPITFGRGMSPAPPAVATGAAPYPAPNVTPGRGNTPFASATPPPPGYSATGTFAGYTPLPVVEEDPEYAAAQARLAQAAAAAAEPRRSTSSEIPAPSLQPRAFDEDHYRGAFDEFVSSKRRLGEPVDAISFEGFKNKLRKIEQTLIEKHGCRAVRFQVVVRDRQVSLRPQLVR